MSVALQIRDVPDEVKDVLAAEARRQGRSVQTYLLGLVEREARLLQNGFVFERTASFRRDLVPDPVDLVREGRDAGFDVDRGQLP